MHQLLNTLYVQTPRSYLHLDHETLKVKVESEVRLQVPLHHLGAIYCIGDVAISTALLHRCAADGRSVVFLSQNGRFQCRVEGPVSGNVLLRQAQYRALADAGQTLALARSFVAAKLQNTRQVVLRGAREASGPEDAGPLQELACRIANVLPRLGTAADLDTVRGLEGDVARRYFEVFGLFVREDREGFQMNGRTRQPPRDRTNALLSFLYTLATGDCAAAVEGVGLDPQAGYLHALRPGRPALALDLVEEFRAVLADRLALTLVNRRQLARGDFEDRPGGAVSLSEAGRKTVLVAYQQRKQEELTHPALTSTQVTQMFQSTASVQAGRHHSQVPGAPGSIRVSIHGQRSSWPTPHPFQHRQRQHQCFNPRPAFKLADTSGAGDFAGADGGFNPRPAFKLADTRKTPAFRPILVTFQSTASVQAGRHQQNKKPSIAVISFNPRPAFKLADTISS